MEEQNRDSVNLKTLQKRASRKKFGKISLVLLLVFLIVSFLPSAAIKHVGFLIGPIYPGIFLVFISAYFISKFTFWIASELQKQAATQVIEGNPNNEDLETNKWVIRKVNHFLCMAALIAAVAMPFDFGSKKHSNAYLSWSSLIVPMLLFILITSIWFSKNDKTNNSGLLYFAGFTILFFVSVFAVMFIWEISDTLDVILDPGTSGDGGGGGFIPNGYVCRFSKFGGGCIAY